MNFLKDFARKHDIFIFAIVLYIVTFGGIFFILSMPVPQEKTAPTPTAEPSADPTATPTPQDGIDIIFIDGIPTATLNYTQETPTPTQKPEEFAPTETPTPRTPSLKGYNEGIPGTYDAGPNGTHTRKPYTAYTCYNMERSAQYQLQKIAETDERTGIRVVRDAEGQKRYCIALGTAWAGGTQKDIGRCVEIVMQNGAVLHCVLADVKKVEDTIDSACMYGLTNNDLIEFIVSTKALPATAKTSGDCSYCGDEFSGEAVRIVVYERNILHD